MPGSFSGLNTLSGALRSFQRGLDITGHNIANVNTRGFTRQSAIFGANTPDSFYGPNGMFQVGSGVGIEGVFRARDSFLDAQMRTANGESGRYSMLADTLKRIEGVFPEPAGPGVADAMQKFFDAWSAMAGSPNDPANKLQVQLTAQTLASRIRSTAGTLTGQAEGIGIQLNDAFERIDELTTQIADLNKQIVAAKVNGASPNDLLDQRDLAIDELSTMMDLTTHEFEDGSIGIVSGEIQLVQQGTSFKVPRQFDAVNQTLSDGTRTFSVRSGALAGLMQSAGEIANVQSQLNTFANTFRDQVNALHRTGRDAAGTTNVDFFEAASTGAADFGLSATIQASPNNIMAGTSGNAGDGGLALALSRLREQSQTALGDRSFKAFYNDLLSGVGRNRAFYDNALDTQGAITAQIDAQRQAVSGVNLDEEMANLVRFQKSYQAAAQALSVINQVTDDLVNMLR